MNTACIGDLHSAADGAPNQEVEWRPASSWQLTFFMTVTLHRNDQRESRVLQSNQLRFQSGGPVLVLQADLNKTNVITGQNVRCCCMACKENRQHQAPATSQERRRIPQ